MRKNVLVSLLFIAVIFTGISYASQEARVLRFPAVYKDQIVFTHAGDLYTVSSKGGVARKLTSHQGFELFARFSPDVSFLPGSLLMENTSPLPGNMMGIARSI